MIAQQPQPTVAYSKDIPGSRLGPEDGPFAYTVLHDTDVWKELAALAKPQSAKLGPERQFKADSINFQPCHVARTQDRYVVKELNIHGRIWTLTGVFDGHLGEITVEHTAFHLPIIVRDFLLDAFKHDPLRSVTPSFIADILSRSITSFDEAIAGDVLNLFPNGMDSVRNMSNEEIQAIINDQFESGVNYKKVRLCMHGTTALVSLVDPEHENLWVVNLGDCQAVLVSQAPSGEWKVDHLSTNHNGDNDAEVARVRAEHPGEPGCVIDRRVLGAIAPFRCIGDVPFKQPPEFTRRILYNLFPGFKDRTAWEDFLSRNRTPPYISSTPEVTHRPLTPHPTSPGRLGRFLVLTSDGFPDLCYDHADQKTIIQQWARGITNRRAGTGPSENMALRLLWQALGGEDRSRVSRVLTLDTDVQWIDDTTIIVQTL